VLTGLMLLCGMVFLLVSSFLPTLVQLPSVYHYVKPAYWLGLPIVPVILLGYVFSGIYAVVTTGLYIERQTRVLPWIAGAGAVLNVALCVVAGARWGIVAVAWATPAAYALMAALGAWQSARVYPVPFEWARLAHLAVIVALLYAADVWITAYRVPPLSARGLIVKIVLLISFPVLLGLTRFFRRGEWQALRAAVLRGRAAVPA
jgi:O-antigen/teichoic acid export membrane protein